MITQSKSEFWIRVTCTALLTTFAQASAYALTNAEPADRADFPSVVLIENSEQKSICTGVVVGRGTVLTAEHCVFLENVRHLKINGHSGAAYQRLVAPNQIGVRNSLDLAVLRVNPDLFPVVTPISRTTPKDLPARVTLVGFGTAYTATGNLVIDETTRMRVGHNMLVSASSTRRLLIDSEPGVYTSGAPSGAMPGDSGGPMFLHGRVIGIASRGGLFGKSVYVNLASSSAAELIDQAIAQGYAFD